MYRETSELHHTHSIIFTAHVYEHISPFLCLSFPPSLSDW
jgi:hypothetical protein